MDVMITENQKIVSETCQRNVKASVTAGFQLLQQLEAPLGQHLSALDHSQWDPVFRHEESEK